MCLAASLDAFPEHSRLGPAMLEEPVAELLGGLRIARGRSDELAQDNPGGAAVVGGDMTDLLEQVRRLSPVSATGTSWLMVSANASIARARRCGQ